ncbi:MAG TPA: hypothetical protein VK619_19915 [Pyrinomonadaceae bacterium]|nr:hypothetical protein [Pyrinomonadaceae bacterium]
MAVLIPILIFAVIIIFVVLVGLYMKKKAKERMLAMQLAAQQMNWGFLPNAAMNAIPYLEQFQLFGRGHSKKILNMIYGQMNDARVSLFDYVFTVGYGRNQQTFYQSVVYFESPRLALPSFTLSPEGLFTKLATAFGYQDIDFEQYPTFSKKYLLRGPDEQAIRQAFNNQIIAYYESNQGLHTDGGGNQIFFYRQNYRVPPTEVRSFVDWGMGLYNLFQRRW